MLKSAINILTICGAAGFAGVMLGIGVTLGGYAAIVAILWVGGRQVVGGELSAGDLVALHYALDGRAWRMVRYCALPLPDEVQLGIVAQSPVGPGTTIDVLSFSVEQRTVGNMRAGV